MVQSLRDDFRKLTFPEKQTKNKKIYVFPCGLCQTENCHILLIMQLSIKHAPTMHIDFFRCIGLENVGLYSKHTFVTPVIFKHNIAIKRNDNILIIFRHKFLMVKISTRKNVFQGQLCFF